MNNENRWIGNLEKSPDNDGLYYVYAINCMDNSNDILKLQFENGRFFPLTKGMGDIMK